MGFQAFRRVRGGRARLDGSAEYFAARLEQRKNRKIVIAEAEPLDHEAVSMPPDEIQQRVLEGDPHARRALAEELERHGYEVLV